MRPINLAEGMEQWTNKLGVDQTADAVESVAGYPRRVYTDAAGVPRLETWTLTGMGHGTPVDPGTGESQCGTAGADILDVNLRSSWYIGRLFGLDDLDPNPPSAALTAPAAGSTVSGAVTVSATASDDVGLARVDFRLDGALLASDPGAPYAATWDTTATTNGAHALQARAVDLADNTGTSSTIDVTLDNGSGGGGGTPMTASFTNEDSCYG